MTEYLCIVTRSRPGESTADFNKRLISFWSRQLRDRPDDYEKVYAETTSFAATEDTVTRSYLVEVEAASELISEFSREGIETLPVDSDDVYSKYEATSPDWFQIEH